MDKLNFVRDFIVFNSNPLFVFLPKELNGSGGDLRLRLEYRDSVKLSIISPCEIARGLLLLEWLALVNSCLNTTPGTVSKCTNSALTIYKIKIHRLHKIKEQQIKFITHLLFLVWQRISSVYVTI